MGLIKLNPQIVTPPVEAVDIDYTHPLAESVLLYTLPAGATHIDVKTNLLLAPSSLGVRAVTPKGIAVRYTSSLHDGELLNTPITFVAGDTWTVSWAGCKDTPGSTAGMIAGDLSSSDFIWMSSGSNTIRYRDTSSTDWNVVGNLSHAVLAWRTMTFDGATARYYEDGIFIGSNGSVDGSLIIDRIADAFNLAGYGLQGNLTSVIVLSKALSAHQVVSMRNDPYQLLKSRTPQVYFPVGAAAGAQNLTATGIASAESFGSPVVTTGAVDLSPTGIASTESIGSPTITTVVNLTASGIASEEAFGSPTVTTGAVNLTATGIASTEAFGSPTVTESQALIATGIPSEEAFGSPTITTGAVTLTATGIASAESFGSPTVSADGDKDIKIDFANEKVLSTNLASTTLYYNGTGYFTID